MVIAMGFLQVLKSNPDLRKLFGKRELVIIEKQLLGVALTQSEKNRLSRDIRQKLKAVAVLARFETEFGLKKGAQTRQWAEEALEIIQENPFFGRIQKIWLFGSTAENKSTLQSDIDLAVEIPGISKEEATRFRKEILGKANPKIDIQAFNLLPPKIQEEIRHKGKILFERTHP